MSAPNDPARDRQLVALARTLEILRGRRRRLLREVAKLDGEIRTTRKLLDSFIAPELPGATERGELPGDGHDPNSTHSRGN